MTALVRRLAVSVLATLAAVGLAVPAQAQDCAALTRLTIPDVRITAAEAIPGGTRWVFPQSPFNIFAGLNPTTDRRFCRVTGVIEAEIGFEVWLPPEWNGRFLGVGRMSAEGIRMAPERIMVRLPETAFSRA